MTKTATKPMAATPDRLALEDIAVTSGNPRNKTDRAALAELTASIVEAGILQPLLVRPVGKNGAARFELVSGYRRLEAARDAGLVEVPVLVRELTDDEAADARLVENLQRQDLAPLDQALGIAARVKAGESVQAVARALGKSPAFVARRANLLKLAPKILEKIKAGKTILAEWPVVYLEELALLGHADQADMIDDYRFGRIPTAADVRNALADRLRRLKLAAWDLEDETLLPKAGSCAKCPLNSANSPDLFGEVGSGKGDDKAEAVCRDGACWTAKKVAVRDQKIAVATEKHGSDLLFMNGEHLRGRDELPEIKGRKVTDYWEVDSAKKGAKGARPALVIDGSGFGTTKWVKPRSSPGGSGRSTKPRPAAEKGTAEDLAAKKERLAAKRAAWIIDTVRAAVDEASWTKFELEKTARLVAAYGCDEFALGKPGHSAKSRAKAFAELDLADVGRGIRANMLGHLGRAAGDDLKPLLAEARWQAATLFGDEFAGGLDARAAEKIPATKSQEALEKRLREAKKTGAATPLRTGKKTKATMRKAAKRGRKKSKRLGKGIA